MALVLIGYLQGSTNPFGMGEDPGETRVSLLAPTHFALPCLPCLRRNSERREPSHFFPNSFQVSAKRRKEFLVLLQLAKKALGWKRFPSLLAHFGDRWKALSSLAAPPKVSLVSAGGGHGASPPASGEKMKISSPLYLLRKPLEVPRNTQLQTANISPRGGTGPGGDALPRKGWNVQSHQSRRSCFKSLVPLGQLRSEPNLMMDDSRKRSRADQQSE